MSRDLFTAVRRSNSLASWSNLFQVTKLSWLKGFTLAVEDLHGFFALGSTVPLKPD